MSSVLHREHILGATWLVHAVEGETACVILAMQDGTRDMLQARRDAVRVHTLSTSRRKKRAWPQQMVPSDACVSC